MNTERIYHTMSDSSSDEDIGVPLAQRLAGVMGRGVSTEHHISPVNDPYKRKNLLSTDSTTAKSSVICQVSDDELELDVARSAPVWRSDSKPTHERSTSAHSMSDSDDSEILPNIIAPKFKSKKVTSASIGERQKKQEEKKKIQEAKKLQKEEERRLKDIEAKRKRIEREQKKALSKNECLKYMSVCLDESIIQNPCGAEILMALKNAGVKYDVQKQSYPNIITFWRETTEVIETETNIRCENKEILEDNVLIWLPIKEFINLVNNQIKKQIGDFLSANEKTLREFVEMAKATLEHRPVTLLVQGLEHYYRMKQNKKSKGAKVIQDMVHVSKMEVDQALISVQIYTSCNVQLMETDSEVARSVVQFTKAIAETPFKRGRAQTGMSFHIDTKGSVKLDRDGTGLLQVWRQQITQFHNVTGQVADAIIREYPSPTLLYQAYQSCETEKQKERLLEDIMVRRVYGPMETSRRVGKEMSRRMYHLFNSLDSDFVLT